MSETTGAVVSHLGIRRDVTERKRVEDEHRQLVLARRVLTGLDRHG